MIKTYKALDHTQNFIITVLASDSKRARLIVQEKLYRNPSRKSYLRSWVKNDQALLDVAARQVIDYFEIEIPDDLETDEEARFDLAVLQAREQSHLYAIPCQWESISDDGINIEIERTRPA